VTTLPAGVSAHASRNLADDATEVIVVNWSAAPVGLAFQVTGLAVAPPAPPITTGGRASGATLLYGSGADQWDSYTYAGSGQAEPTATVTADGDGIQIGGGFVPPIEPNGDYLDVGLYFDGSSCVDASAYTGVKFDFSGDLGGCSLAFGVSFFGDLSNANGAKGGCSGASSMCYGPLAPVSPGATTVLIPFASLGGGMPIAGLDPTTLVTVEWQLGAAIGVDGGGCAANFAVENVSFY
jgi:hypothetical protein